MCSWLFWAFESPPRCLPSITEALEEGLICAVLTLSITAGVTVSRLLFFSSEQGRAKISVFFRL